MIARRLRPFGTTIFTQTSALAASTGAVNLGQGPRPIRYGAAA